MTRDEGICHYCSEQVSASDGTIDHVWPKIRGGVNANWNLVWSCSPCNVRLGDQTDKCSCEFCEHTNQYHSRLPNNRDTAMARALRAAGVVV